MRPASGGGKVTVTYDDGTGAREENLTALLAANRVEWLLPDRRDAGCERKKKSEM